ncbi:MAG TPA: tRNA pseudouridine(55) synthase TruB [Syntrophales bacterium]|nr:tRNA pseudouridine(55) synthase TruB [Syntrophales bacterium]
MNGIIVIDKPTGRTSFDVVREVRGLVGTRKAGHTGTLDPLASGVLPVCVGEATKLVPFLTDDDKEYVVTARFGVETDTFDGEGTVLAIRPVDFGEEDLREALPAFRGTLVQVPPRYSAVKVQGRPLHRWARKGVALEPPARTVTVYRFDLLRFEAPFGTFFIHCAKGTYVRSLCSDLGRKLGCGAAVIALRRTRSGRFGERDALSLQGLGREGKRASLERNVISLERALGHMPSLVVDEETEKRIRNGRPPTEESLKKQVLPFLEKGNLIQFLSEESRVVAIGKIEDPPGEKRAGDRAIRIVRVFR